MGKRKIKRTTDFDNSYKKTVKKLKKRKEKISAVIILTKNSANVFIKDGKNSDEIGSDLVLLGVNLIDSTEPPKPLDNKTKQITETAWEKKTI